MADKEENNKEEKYDNSTHHLYLHPSDHPGMILVSTPLTEDNYASWSQAMLLALEAKNKLGFIDGTVSPPTSNTSAEARQWKRCNVMVISWLLNSISKEISSSVIYCKSAFAIWIDLKDRYSQINGPRLYKLKQDISNLVQGSLSVTGYFAKLKGLWDELAEIQSPHICTCRNCTCGARKENLAQREADNVLTFLMGLNESYAATRGHILLMDPLPNVSRTYALVLQEERHRSVSITPAIESIALAATNPSRKYGRAGPFKKSLKCTHCGKDGHTIDCCYRIHGFPPGPLNSKPGSGPKHSAHQVSSTTSSLPFTPEQCQQLLAILNNSAPPQAMAHQAGSVESSLAGPTLDEDDWDGN